MGSRLRRLLALPLRLTARHIDARRGGRLVRMAHRLEGFVDVSDDCTRWLATVIPGMLHRGNLQGFVYALRNLPSAAPVLEIGAFCGLSTCVLAYYLRRLGRVNTLVTCDSWKFAGLAGRTLDGLRLSHDALGDFVRQSFIRNVERFVEPPAGQPAGWRRSAAAEYSPHSHARFP